MPCYKETSTPAAGYDSANRLVVFNRGILSSDGGSSITLSLSLPGVDSQRLYTLDGTGNWVYDGIWNTGEPALRFTHDCASTSQNRTANNLNQIATIDGSGLTYDAKGNLAAYNGLNFTYDAFNRLIGVSGTGPSGSSVNMSYTYDALGRRVLSNPNSMSSMNTYYIYDGAQVIEEYSGSDLTSLRRQYVWGQYVDELIQQREYQRPTNGATYEDLYPLTNLNYCAVALSRQNPCGTGSSAGAGGPSSSGPANPFAEVYDTDPYGRTRVYSGPGPDGKWFTDDDVQTFGPIGRYIFTGREYDAETGLYYYRARHYHPDLGRFLSRDPIGYGGGMNLYGYCENPVTNVDPSGEVVIAGLIGIFGALAASYGARQMEKNVGAEIRAQNNYGHDPGYMNGKAWFNLGTMVTVGSIASLSMTAGGMAATMLFPGAADAFAGLRASGFLGAVGMGAATTGTEFAIWGALQGGAGAYSGGGDSLAILQAAESGAAIGEAIGLAIGFGFGTAGWGIGRAWRFAVESPTTRDWVRVNIRRRFGIRYHWGSNDVLVGRVANAIESRYPGLIRAVNVSEAANAENDIVLENALLEISRGGSLSKKVAMRVIGNKPGNWQFAKFGQLLNPQDLPIITYRPLLTEAQGLDIARRGGIPFGGRWGRLRNLIQTINPDL